MRKLCTMLHYNIFLYNVFKIIIFIYYFIYYYISLFYSSFKVFFALVLFFNIFIFFELFSFYSYLLLICLFKELNNILKFSNSKKCVSSLMHIYYILELFSLIDIIISMIKKKF